MMVGLNSRYSMIILSIATPWIDTWLGGVGCQKSILPGRGVFSYFGWWIVSGWLRWWTPEHGLRRMMDAILYVGRTGIPWRYLPYDFAPWGTVYGSFAAWQKDAVFDQFNSLLRRLVREAEGRAVPAGGSGWAFRDRDVSFVDWRVLYGEAVAGLLSRWPPFVRPGQSACLLPSGSRSVRRRQYLAPCSQMTVPSLRLRKAARASLPIARLPLAFV